MIIQQVPREVCGEPGSTCVPPGGPIFRQGTNLLHVQAKPSPSFRYLGLPLRLCCPRASYANAQQHPVKRLVAMLLNEDVSDRFASSEQCVVYVGRNTAVERWKCTMEWNARANWSSLP